jgi:hypothetical protein
VELEALFGRLERLGFTRRQLRDATLTLLQEDGAPRAGDEHVSGEDHFVGAEELLTI